MSYNYNYNHRQKPYSNGHNGGYYQSGYKSYGSRSGYGSYSQSSGYGGSYSQPPAKPASVAKPEPKPIEQPEQPEPSIYNVIENSLVGTDMHSGVNSHDDKFPKLLLHSDCIKNPPPDRPSHKNYKVAYDPELDKVLSKAEKKTKHIKLKHQDPNFVGTISDPRITFQGGLDSYMHKPNKRSKKFPFKQLPQTKFVFDEDSIGPPPPSELVIWDVPATTSEVYISNFFKSYGSPIKDLKSINDSEFGVPLGVVTFKFQGTPEKASRLAEKVVQESNSTGIKLDGVLIKIGVNGHDNKFLTDKIKAAELKIHNYHEKLQEEKKKAKLLQEEKEKEQKKEQEKARAEAKQTEQTPTKEEPPKETFKSNITILSKLINNKKIAGCFLPKELEKYVKERPYILIRDKHISTKAIASHDLKKALSKYSWTRILGERDGFFIVFNSLKECERCFYKEDASKFYEYRMVMELCIPEGFKGDQANSDASRHINVVNEATNMLIKDFEAYLTKDIRERVIAPVILDLLSDNNYPEIIGELRAKEAAQKKELKTVNTTTKLKQDALSVLAARKQQILPTFRKKPLIKSEPKKRAIIPMSHALNFDDDSDDSDGASSRSMTPVATNLKRQISSATTSVSSDIDTKEPPMKKKRTKSFLYDSEDDMEVDEKVDLKEEHAEEPEQEQEEEGVPEVADKLEDIDYSEMDEIWQPTYDHPRPVYEDDIFSSSKFNLQDFKSLIRDKEDLELAKEAMKATEPDQTINNIDYWAWKLNEFETNVPDIVEDEDDILPLDTRLESSSGSFRSEGYKKIPDSDKIEYLPHRRKVHKPLKTIQHEDEESEKQGNVHSSRVNRANNRRLAADISAQKQMIGSETDILNLNSLTKRKKPVSFARSAIHNWGLYALEPIGAKEMIIEYVGESIRQQVAEHRERSYLKTGIGSSYLFRIDENTVIDATKKGGIARFINHCCSPSCTAKIIKVDGKKRIVIYALRDIDANEELTYDYKFERETDDNERIRCLCGAPGCKGYLN